MLFQNVVSKLYRIQSVEKMKEFFQIYAIIWQEQACLSVYTVIKKKTMQWTYDVTFRLLPLAIVAVEKKKVLHII